MALKEINFDLKLILIGNELSNGKEYRSLANKLGIEKNVVFGGFVDENSKYTLLRNAYALIYPSLFEGYGMPLIESILETPV